MGVANAELHSTGSFPFAVEPEGRTSLSLDADAPAYAEAMRRQRAINARREQAEQDFRSHPGPVESAIPGWGSAREAVADGLEGDVRGAVLNGALAASELVVAGSLAKGISKGAVFVAREGTKRAAPYGWKGNVRKWMGEQGHLAPGSTAITGRFRRIVRIRMCPIGSKISLGTSRPCRVPRCIGVSNTA